VSNCNHKWEKVAPGLERCSKCKTINFKKRNKTMNPHKNFIIWASLALLVAYLLGCFLADYQHRSIAHNHYYLCETYGQEEACEGFASPIPYDSIIR